MSVEYLFLSPQGTLPQLGSGPFRCVIISETPCDDHWRNAVADALMAGACLYAICWGVDCSDWHDAVDSALLRAFDFGEVPDERHIMTTWHDKEPLDEALWFACHCADHPVAQLDRTLLLHIAHSPREEELLARFEAALSDT